MTRHPAHRGTGTPSPEKPDRRVCERPSNPSAGDKMTGTNRILQGSLVQQHGAGLSLISPLENLFLNKELK